jgi:DNA replication and repair protein RecF
VRFFRNLGELRLSPDPSGLTIVTGANGAGKTSFLEAIAYASTLSSFRNSPRDSMVQNSADRSFVRVESQTENHTSLIEIEIPRDGRDRVQRNRQRVRRGAELLEALRVTVFTPEDLALVKSGPQHRRDFLDDALVGTDPRRLETRQTVERVLRQRATLLRQAGGYAAPDVLSTLDIWDAQLASAGGELIAGREEIAAALEPLASDAYQRLTGSEDGIRLVYERSFEGDLGSALALARKEDLRRGVSTVGPHRDDLAVYAGDLDARTRLSQGRQRCVTLALRLATHRVVTKSARTSPVLLLDDAFSELDEHTAQALFNELPAGQALLTTAGPLPVGAEPAMIIRLVDGAVS